MLLTEEQQRVAVNALATTLGKPAAEIETILAGEKPTEVDTLVSERIKIVRKEGEKAGKGILQKEANKKAKELFGTDAADVDTITGLLDAVKEGYKPAVDPASLTEEQVKSHPAFRTLEATLTGKEAEHQKALEKARTEAKAEVDREKLAAKLIKARADYGAVLSEDPKIAAVQERMFLEGIEGISTKQVDGKVEYWRQEADGSLKRIETDKLLPVSEEDFLKGLVEKTYTIKVSDQKSGTGLPPNPGGTGKPGTFTHFKGAVPKTQEEVNAILLDRGTHSFEAREEVTKYWAESQKP